MRGLSTTPTTPRVKSSQGTGIVRGKAKVWRQIQGKVKRVGKLAGSRSIPLHFAPKSKPSHTRLAARLARHQTPYSGQDISNWKQFDCCRLAVDSPIIPGVAVDGALKCIDRGIARSGTVCMDDDHGLTNYTERMVPEQAHARIFWEHIARYRFAKEFVTGKRVLDIACGEGYGAAALAKAGAHERDRR